MKFLINLILRLRQWVFILYTAIITIIFSSLIILLWSVKAPILMRLSIAQLWSYLIRFGMFIFLWLRLRIHNRENIPNYPCILLSKHQSPWETFILPSIGPRSCYVLKKELLAIPWFGWGLRAGENIAIDRSQSMKALKDVIAQGKDRLSKGVSITVFPEGTRVQPKTNPKFHKSALSLAKMTKSTVVPIAHNAGSFWPARGGIIKPGTIDLVIGTPIDSTKLSLEELSDQCYQWMVDEMRKIEG
ncbi:1-acyl-sn-glycerol-3-phosphate acyltransferase [Thiotrichales bacterium 19S9-12]|nr:1-acyl-sn-glycerol-3-phosphate acyltransferase [Thiotrichales bacterium 19S9-11]MCF6811817.1 1-acyl-sn-glycerol-3-phosphate acyltransferase [Thiotrichales bacterium 19S9-12]